MCRQNADAYQSASPDWENINGFGFASLHLDAHGCVLSAMALCLILSVPASSTHLTWLLQLP